MKVVTDLQRPVREIENLFIELADGCRLAARIWLPEDAEADPVPAILEYLPYRKRDGTSQRDALTHPYFAGHGYACLRVDMRGNGEFGRADARRVYQAGAGRRAGSDRVDRARSPGARVPSA